MSRKKILVADDEADIRHRIRQTLSKDYETVEAEDGIEAALQAKEESPDLIMLDTMKPRQDGYKTCMKIKSSEETRNTLVVMLTGVDYEFNRKLGEPLGTAEYITKPLRWNRLSRR
ncbi:MAG: response regulator [Dehalococcoidia bacterium]|nr:MAG: response regulator [Dehalococcoidia bacterium]